MYDRLTRFAYVYTYVTVGALTSLGEFRENIEILVPSLGYLTIFNLLIYVLVTRGGTHTRNLTHPPEFRVDNI